MSFQLYKKMSSKTDYPQDVGLNQAKRTTYAAILLNVSFKKPVKITYLLNYHHITISYVASSWFLTLSSWSRS